MEALHLHGRIELDEGEVLDEVWVLDGRLSHEPPARGVPVRALAGWVVPGLVDVHCHIGLGAQGPVDDRTAEQQAIADRDSGVLLIRDAGSPVDTRWVQKRVDLPHLIRSGQHIALAKRYLRGFGVELQDAGNLPDEVRTQARSGDDWVKIVADWIDRSEGANSTLRPLWPDDVLAEAIRVAHDEGARVTAHTFSTQALDGLIDAGIDCIEHGTGLTQEHMRVLAQRGIPVTPTLLQVGQFAAFAAQAGTKYPVYGSTMLEMHARRYEHVKQMFDHGIQLLIGTDAGGTLEHGLIASECAELVRAGVPAREVLAAGTWRARTFLSVEPLTNGTLADVVVYRDDPAADIATLGRPEAVILRGRVVAGNLAE